MSKLASVPDQGPTRREVLSGLGLAVASLASSAEAQTAPPARAFRGAHAPRPLPFDAAKLTGISEKLIRSHWENNYGGAVKALNAVEERLAAAMNDKDLPPYLYGDWKREELVRTGSVVLHENYFGNLGGDGKASGAGLALVVALVALLTLLALPLLLVLLVVRRETALSRGARVGGQGRGRRGGESE